MNKQLIFFGNERLATATPTPAPILRGLIKAGYGIEAVVVSDEARQSGVKTDSRVELVAKKNGISVIILTKNDSLALKLRGLAADFGVLAAFGRLVPPTVIDLFPQGIINLHPSLLPKLRGPTPVESAVLEGLTETGVSLMKLTSELDAGPVYAQASVKLRGDETKQALASRLAEMGRNLLIDSLPGILSGKLTPKEQDEKAAIYTSKIEKNDGKIDWRKSASQIEREIRAYAGWPGSFTNVFGKEVIITKAHLVPGISKTPGTVEVLAEDGILMIHTAGGYLCIDKLKPAGKAEMSTAEFLRGYYKP